MKKQIIFLFLLTVLVSACSIFKGGKKEVTGISFEYDVNKPVNYGYRLPIKIIASYSNGKSKDVTSKDGLSIDISGAKYSNGIIRCNSNPTSFQKDTIYLKASYLKNEKTFTKSVVLPFNYKGSLNFNCNGSKGFRGGDGSKGGTSMIFRYGKDGTAGLSGSDGTIGHDLTVFIWKELSLFYIKIYDMTSEKTYYYKANNNTTSYNYYVNGGQGGQGGKGGDGKDGKKTEKKTKLPGDGGNGGIGGPGGNGGKGGNIYIFIHPTATDFQNKIYTNNNGGAAGAGGSGGKGGSAGTPLEGQSAKNSGSTGGNGINGLTGANGDVINIEVQQFDIEDAKNN